MSKESRRSWRRALYRTSSAFLRHEARSPQQRELAGVPGERNRASVLQRVLATRNTSSSWRSFSFLGTASELHQRPQWLLVQANFDTDKVAASLTPGFHAPAFQSKMISLPSIHAYNFRGSLEALQLVKKLQIWRLAEEDSLPPPCLLFCVLYMWSSWLRIVWQKRNITSSFSQQKEQVFKTYSAAKCRAVFRCWCSVSAAKGGRSVTEKLTQQKMTDW